MIDLDVRPKEPLITQVVIQQKELDNLGKQDR